MHAHVRAGATEAVRGQVVIRVHPEELCALRARRRFIAGRERLRFDHAHSIDRDVHARHADDPQLGVLDSPPGLEQSVDSLVRPQQAEEQHHAPVALKRRSHRRPFGQVRERSVRDHVHALGVDTQLVCEARAAVLGVDDDRVEALIQAPLARELAPAGFARKDVVRGQHQRAPARQQARIELLNREPLKMHDVRGASGALVAKHVGDVLGQLLQAPRRGARRKAVCETARVQLHLSAGRRQRTRQRVVVGRRVGGWVDDVDAHCKAQ